MPYNIRGIGKRDPRQAGLGAPSGVTPPTVSVIGSRVHRIRISDTPYEGGSIFVFGVNPSEYDSVDSYSSEVLQPIHGTQIHQQMAYDNRERTMKWKGFPYGHDPLEDIIDFFKDAEGQVKYFDFQDLEPINERWPTVSTWKKARILSMRVKPRSGGQLVYDEVELIIQPEE